MHRFTALLTAFLLLGTVLATSTAQPATARDDDSPRWSIADQREIDVDGTIVSLSPDGQWIAGIGPDQAFCIWAAEDLAETCEPTDNPPLAASFAWAPDSSSIAWSSDAARLLIDSDIMLFDIASMTLNNLTDTPDEPRQVSLSNANPGTLLMDVFPTWTPDGKTIVFLRGEFGDSAPNTKLMTLDPETGETDLYFLASPNELLTIYSLMFFQPDGSLLVAVHPMSSGSAAHGIWRIAPGGSRIDKIISSSETSEFPFALITAISADGTQAALVSPVAYSLPPEEQHPYALLDLESGKLTIPGDDKAKLSGTASFGGPANQLIYPSFGSTETERIITIGSGTLDATFPATVMVGGSNWAANNTVLLPYNRDDAGISGVLLTLTTSDEDRGGDSGTTGIPTPKPPCGCVQPPD